MGNALILGFGGSGAQTLTFVKEIAVWKEGKTPEQVSFLLFDTIEGWKAGKTVQFLGGRGTEKLAQSRDKAANLDESSEYFHLGDQDPNLNRRVTDPKLPEYLSSWLHAQWLALHVPEAARSIKDGAAQQRQIGRFAIFQNAMRIRARLRDIFRRTHATNVWLVGSAAGGTGAGGLLDAALLVRLAARDEGIGAPKITGVVVLPDVYADKAGISKGRAYAFLRELARLQENGFDASEDAFRVDSGGNITVRVRYDNSDKITATRNLGGLFDCVFYVSDQCRDDAARESFFSSLANAIDPYLDAMAGPSLLQGSVNEGGKLPSSFGASRIYLPMQTLADLYGWEEVESYIGAITAPKVEESRVVDVEGGADTDLRARAKETVSLLLPFFGYLDNVAATVDPDKWKDVGLALMPLRLVEEHLQFANAQQAGLKLAAGDAQLVGQTYRNPYISLTASEEATKPEQWRLKTYEQMRKSGQKESLEESQGRFQKELETITSTYRSAQPGERSFAKGAEVIRQRLMVRLQERVDELVMTAFEADAIGAKDGNGTVLTRLFKLLEEALADEGPIRNARAVLSVMRDAVREQESRVGQKLQQVQADLKQWNRNEWWKGGSFTNASALTDMQSDVASTAAKAATAFQRYRLLELVADLLDLTEQRLNAWYAQAKAMLNGLLLEPGTGAAFGLARGAIGELQTRLARQAANHLAVIDPVNARGNQPGDVELHGYRKILKRDLTTLPGGLTLSEDGVAKSRWEAIVDAGNRPRLVLRTEGGVFDEMQLANFALGLHQTFRRHIDRVVQTKSIFDYLRYSQANSALDPKEIAQILDTRAKALINLPNAVEEKYLTYATPQGPEAANLAQAFGGHIAGMQFYAHTDRFSICLLKVKKPADATDIQDVEQCLHEYLKLQTEKLKGVQSTDYDLRRAEVYHIFRAELEAWYIEREALLQRRIQATVDHHIPPRIARLLDDPERMSAFVKCLATGVIWQDDNGWWWRAPDGEKVPLNDPSEGRTTLVRAAVNFVLRGEAGTVMGSQTIPIQDVHRSVARAVAESQKTESELLKAFAAPENLDAFLKQTFANLRDAPDKQYERQRDGLKTVLQFYATPGRSTDLVKRMLP